MAVSALLILSLLSVFNCSCADEKEPVSFKLYNILQKATEVESKIEKWENEREAFQESVLSVLEHRKNEMKQFRDEIENKTQQLSEHHETSPCDENPCAYGKCFTRNDEYVCVCDLGYTGKLCNTKDSCLLSPCLKGACVNNGANFTCICPLGITGRKCETIMASDCYDTLKTNPGSKSGVYWVKLWKTHEHVQVFCDMETASGGWTVFQRRLNGSVDFYRNYDNYVVGFGSLSGEFWLGLQNIYEMASQTQSELRIDLMAADGTTAYEVFPDFRLSPSSSDYALNIGKGSGTAGDSGKGLSYNNGVAFSTYDHGNKRCALDNMDNGAWWYKSCTYVNLNGEYVTPGSRRQIREEGGMIYREFQDGKSLKQSKMMFRRTSK